MWSPLSPTTPCVVGRAWTIIPIFTWRKWFRSQGLWVTMWGPSSSSNSEFIALSSKESRTAESCMPSTSPICRTFSPEGNVLESWPVPTPAVVVCTILMGKCVQGKRHMGLQAWGEGQSLSSMTDPASTLFPQSWKALRISQPFMDKTQSRFTSAFSGHHENSQNLQAPTGSYG